MSSSLSKFPTHLFLGHGPEGWGWITLYKCEICGQSVPLNHSCESAHEVFLDVETFPEPLSLAWLPSKPALLAWLKSFGLPWKGKEWVGPGWYTLQEERTNVGTSHFTAEPLQARLVTEIITKSTRLAAFAAALQAALNQPEGPNNET